MGTSIAEGASVVDEHDDRVLLRVKGIDTAVHGQPLVQSLWTEAALTRAASAAWPGLPWTAPKRFGCWATPPGWVTVAPLDPSKMMTDDPDIRWRYTRKTGPRTGILLASGSLGAQSTSSC